MIRKETLQGVIIATPNYLHVSMGITCAQHGLHLFVEKPIAASLSEADRLIEAATQNGVRILVGHQRRFNALIEKTREIVRGGELGKLVGVASRGHSSSRLSISRGLSPGGRAKGVAPSSSI